MQQYQRTTFRNLMGQVTYKQTRHSAVTLPSSNNHKLRNTRQWHIIEAIPSVPRPQPKTLSNASKNLDLLPTRSKAAKTLQLGFLDNQVNTAYLYLLPCVPDTILLSLQDQLSEAKRLSKFRKPTLTHTSSNAQKLDNLPRADVTGLIFQLKNQNFGCKTRLLNKLRKQHYESSSPNHDLRVKESKADKNIMEHVPGEVLDSATG